MYETVAHFYETIALFFGGTAETGEFCRYNELMQAFSTPAMCNHNFIIYDKGRY